MENDVQEFPQSSGCQLKKKSLYEISIFYTLDQRILYSYIDGKCTSWKEMSDKKEGYYNTDIIIDESNQDKKYSDILLFY